MRNRERDMSYAQAAGNIRCPTVETDRWAAARLPDYLNLQPAYAVADSGAEGLSAGFFRGKSGRQALGRIALAEAIGLLCRGVDPIQKALAKPPNRLLNPGDLNQVDAAADDHAEYKTNTGASDHSFAGTVKLVPDSHSLQFDLELPIRGS